MVVPATRYVLYYRVSTARQGQLGSGHEAQQVTVRSFGAYPAQLLIEYFRQEKSLAPTGGYCGS